MPDTVGVSTAGPLAGLGSTGEIDRVGKASAFGRRAVDGRGARRNSAGGGHHETVDPLGTFPGPPLSRGDRSILGRESRGAICFGQFGPCRAVEKRAEDRGCGRRGHRWRGHRGRRWRPEAHAAARPHGRATAECHGKRHGPPLRSPPPRSHASRPLPTVPPRCLTRDSGETLSCCPAGAASPEGRPAGSRPARTSRRMCRRGR